MRSGVTFGEKHSLDDFGLIFNSKTISEPVAQTNYVSVPGRNGAIDLSEVVTGKIKYDNREIKIDFTITENVSLWEKKREQLANYLHGKKMRIVFDDDQNYYWLGRCSVSDLKPSGSVALVTIKAEVEPYKYNVTTSAEDWLWDPFDFEEGVINEFSNIVVNGTTEVELICTGKVQNPIITTSSAMQVTLDNETTVTIDGEELIYEFVLDAGVHTIKFVGNGTASINYVGGSL